MAAYSALIPCTILFALPVGSWLVLQGIIELSQFALVLCLALGLGSPLLRTMSFTSVMPQVKYKIDELEKLMDIPPLKEGSALLKEKIIIFAMIMSALAMMKRNLTSCMS